MSTFLLGYIPGAAFGSSWQTGAFCAGQVLHVDLGCAYALGVTGSDIKAGLASEGRACEGQVNMAAMSLLVEGAPKIFGPGTVQLEDADVLTLQEATTGRSYKLVTLRARVAGQDYGLVGASFEGEWPAQEAQLTVVSKQALGEAQLKAKGENFPHYIQRQNPLPCFVAGTKIATHESEISVENLRIGDVIMAADGALIEVKWLGQKTVSASAETMPVRIMAGALGRGLPLRDLLVSRDQAMILDELLVDAGALVNGSTIAFVRLEEMPRTFVYYHIETANQAAILANGTPTETFMDHFSRPAFDNYAQYAALYDEARIARALGLARVSSDRFVPHPVRERIAQTAARQSRAA